MKSQNTAAVPIFSRRSCAVPEELIARRSTLARSANQYLASLTRAHSWKMEKSSRLGGSGISFPEGS